MTRESGEQAEAAEVFLAPSGLNLNHASQHAGAERVGCVVERNGNAASVGMAVVAMASLLAGEEETVT